MSKLKSYLEINPILVKELRSRMRGFRAFAILTGVLVMLAAISYLLYRVVLSSTRYSSTPVSPQIGQALLIGLAMVELMMVCFITPAITSGAISSEREKLTYEMLLATPLRPGRLLWGKLISALSYVFLLILAAVPMASLVFIFGGVALWDMVKAIAVLLATTITLGVIGIFMSAWLRRTVPATVLSYLAVLGLVIGPLMVYIFVGVLWQKEPPRWILVPNPVSALFSAFASTSSGGSGNILGGLGRLLSGSISLITGSSSFSGIPRPLYHYTLPFYGALSLALYLIATRLVRPSRRWRLHFKDILIVLALFALFGGMVATPFLLTADRYENLPILPEPTIVPEAPISRVGVALPTPQVVTVVPASLSTPTPVSVTTAPHPTFTPAPTATGTALFSEEEQAAIYAAVIRQLYTVDHTFGHEFSGFPVVYLLRTTDDSAGDPDAPHSESQTLSEAVQTAITDALRDLPARWVWIDSEKDAPRDEQGTITESGAIFTVGNIHRRLSTSQNENDAVLVSARLYFAMLGGGGQTYVLEKQDGVWRITGNTGVQWIS